MPAPTMSHIIGIGALVTLIFVMPLFYFSIVNTLEVEMMERELKEVADYVSNSLWNLYLLANSTNFDVLVTKELDLPLNIRDSPYYIEIVCDQDDSAQYVKAYPKGNSRIHADSLILPGLTASSESDRVIESGDKLLIAGCSKDSAGIYVWVKEE